MDARKRILEVATEQFTRFGVRTVTMEDLARQAGISKKTIYQEFEDKKDLVNAVFTTILEEDQRKLSLILEQGDGVIEHLVKTSRMMRDRLTSINPLVIMEVQKYFPEAWKLFESFKEQTIKKDLINVLDLGKQLGYFRSEIDSRVLAKVRLSQITTAFEPRNFADPDYNLVEEQMVILDHFLHGIFTDKGRQAYLAQKDIFN
ncbi:MAG: TetR/AcrR family transcriptional regulator [Bacteroidetes bacterium]|nr:TetR/AcrR family transcriptional regulator [Bacteroidota bacterium]